MKAPFVLLSSFRPLCWSQCCKKIPYRILFKFKCLMFWPVLIAFSSRSQTFFGSSKKRYRIVCSLSFYIQYTSDQDKQLCGAPCCLMSAWLQFYMIITHTLFKIHLWNFPFSWFTERVLTKTTRGLSRAGRGTNRSFRKKNPMKW